MCLGWYKCKEQVQLRADTAWEESMCCQILDAGSCRRKMSLSSWLLNLRETITAKFYMSFGKAFEAKTTKNRRLFYLNTVLGHYP